MARTLFASKKVYPDLKYRIVGILTKIEYLIIKGLQCRGQNLNWIISPDDLTLS